MRVLRTMLFVPGNNMRMIHKTKTLDADAFILDLEDAVPMEEKETARVFIEDALDWMGPEGLDVFVRVNTLATGLTPSDIEAAVREGIGGIMLPKSESKGDVLEVDRLIEDAEGRRGLKHGSTSVIPLIETARGVLNAPEISTAGSRIVAVSFGAVDFTRDMGTTISREGTELFYARSRISLVARASGVQAIDTVWVDIMDREGLLRDARLAKQLGFRGKLLIHPNQIEPVNGVFSPSEQEVRYAQRVVEAFREAEARGLGAISLEGRMIDTASYRQALDLLSLAEAIEEKRMKRREAPWSP
ncbi:MAG: HpcH/HpaI aldolase/citrate lyase family protein [Candidatus Bathyarchaeia archaeon]